MQIYKVWRRSSNLAVTIFVHYDLTKILWQSQIFYLNSDGWKNNFGLETVQICFVMVMNSLK